MTTRPASKCSRCNGHGTIPAYRHVNNGICFRCGGLGIVDASLEETLALAERKAVPAEVLIAAANETHTETSDDPLLAALGL